MYSTFVNEENDAGTVPVNRLPPPVSELLPRTLPSKTSPKNKGEAAFQRAVWSWTSTPSSGEERGAYVLPSTHGMGARAPRSTRSGAGAQLHEVCQCAEKRWDCPADGVVGKFPANGSNEKRSLGD